MESNYSIYQSPVCSVNLTLFCDVLHTIMFYFVVCRSPGTIFTSFFISNLEHSPLETLTEVSKWFYVLFKFSFLIICLKTSRRPYCDFSFFFSVLYKSSSEETFSPHCYIQEKMVSRYMNTLESLKERERESKNC